MNNQRFVQSSYLLIINNYSFNIGLIIDKHLLFEPFSFIYHGILMERYYFANCKGQYSESGICEYCTTKNISSFDIKKQYLRKH